MPSKPDPDIDRVSKCVASLAEHFDAVLILVERHESGGTTFVQKGAGSNFARYGMAKHYLLDSEVSMKNINAEDKDGD